MSNIAPVPVDTVELIPDRKYVFCTKDNQKVTVDSYVIRECHVLADVIGYLRPSTDEIPISAINATDFNKCVRFFSFFKNEPPYVPPASYTSFRRPPVDCPGRAFLNTLTLLELKGVISAANFLNAIRLIDYTMYTLFHFVTANTTLEVRRAFGFITEYTDEEEKYFLEQHIVSEDDDD